ncbi:MAG: ParB/RepB/Spo0J family partition protein [Planctomycetes bacterium]|nr:ParB/RepB/Spo0J family partition protein [Planctomycetota bacterium]
MAKKLGRGLGDIISNQPKISAKPEMIPFLNNTSIAPLPRPISIKLEAKPELKDTHSPEKVLPTKVTSGVDTLNIADIIPNRFQPRKEFDPQALNELAESIKASGVIQPLLVRAAGSKYELIAGERRWRACQILKLEKAPAIIKQADDRTMLEWAIIENTQRKDLNPIEKGRAYKDFADVFKLTHEEVGKRIGLDRSTVTNFIRLLELPKEIQDEVSRGTITMGHARALLGVSDKQTQIKLAQRIKKEGMSVRKLEYNISYLNRKQTQSAQPPSQNLYLKELEERLRRKFGTKITITAYKSKGYIGIHFFTNDDFQRILELLESK